MQESFMLQSRQELELREPIDQGEPGRPRPEDVRLCQDNPGGAEARMRAEEGFVGCVFTVFCRQVQLSERELGDQVLAEGGGVKYLYSPRR